MSKPFDIIVRNRWNTTKKSVSTGPSSRPVLGVRMSHRKLVEEMQASVCCHKCGKAEHSKSFVPKYLSTGIVVSAQVFSLWDEVVLHPYSCFSIAIFPFMEDQSLLVPLQMPQVMLLAFEPGKGMKLIYFLNNWAPKTSALTYGWIVQVFFVSAWYEGKGGIWIP